VKNAASLYPEKYLSEILNSTFVASGEGFNFIALLVAVKAHSSSLVEKPVGSTRMRYQFGDSVWVRIQFLSSSISLKVMSAKRKHLSY